MSRITIDCRFASGATGLGTYTRHLVQELVAQGEHEYVLLVHNVFDSWLSDMSVDIIGIDVPHYSLKEQWALPRIIQSVECDGYFCPHFNVPLQCPVPFVVTIHDLILHEYPNQASLPKQLAYRVLMKQAVSRAKQVIAVSEFTATELKRVYGAEATVVPEGISIDPAVSPTALEGVEVPEEFFLYVGNAKEHKNVQTLLNAHRALGTDATPLLLVSGGPELSHLTMHDGVHVLRDIHHAQLSALYKQARCFVTPSLYEGFCLPVLEAQAAGCPIIASNRTAIPELAGPHTMLVEPTEAGLLAALQHPPTAADTPQPQYTWANAAKLTATVLQSAF